LSSSYPFRDNRLVTYKVVLIRSDEGYAVSCPALPGCHSQGDTEAEALDNIRDAISGWLAVAQSIKAGH